MSSVPDAAATGRSFAALLTGRLGVATLAGTALMRRWDGSSYTMHQRPQEPTVARPDPSPLTNLPLCSLPFPGGCRGLAGGWG